MDSVNKTFSFTSAQGAITITADLREGIYDNIQFNASPSFHALPSSRYLEELITYAVLEGTKLDSGDMLDFVLDKEEGYPADWTWYGDEVGKVLGSFSAIAA